MFLGILGQEGDHGHLWQDRQLKRVASLPKGKGYARRGCFFVPIYNILPINKAAK